MTTFADIVAAAGNLSADEQESLIAILQRRLTDENRKQLRGEVDAARAEHASGATRTASSAELMDEIRRDP
jgi:hypothetical protein